MKKFRYSCRQSFKSFLVDRKKFYFTAIEICLAVILCNVLSGAIFSMQIVKDQLQSGIDNSVLIFPTYFNIMKDDVSDIRSGKSPRPVSMTKDDIEEIEGFFGNSADSYYVVRFGISVYKENSEFENIIVFFTNALSSGECYLSESAQKVVDDLGFKIHALSSKEKIATILLNDLRQAKYRPVALSQTLIERHLVTDKVNTTTNDITVFLPLTVYFENIQSITNILGEMIAIYFAGEFDSRGVFQTVQLLNQRHGDHIFYRFHTGHQDLRQKVRELQASIFALSVIACGVFLILILGMGGLVAALIKKREKEISIQLCLGVDLRYLYMESLFKILVPAGIAGIVGSAISIPVIYVLKLEVMKTFWMWGGVLISFGIVIMIASLASVLPLLELRRIHPIQILRGDQ